MTILQEFGTGPGRLAGDGTSSHNFSFYFTKSLILQRFEKGLSSDKEVFIGTGADTNKIIERYLKVLQEKGYVVFSLADFTHAVHYTDDGMPDAVVAIIDRDVNKTVNDTPVKISAYGDPESIRKAIQIAKLYFVERKGVLIHTVYKIDSDGDCYSNHDFVETSNAILGRASFYPWIGVPLEDYFDAYMASSESLLVLYGPPGTAKSTFIRTLLHYHGRDVMIAYNKDVTSSPHLMDGFYKNPDASFLVCEDIDENLKKREDGNELMSSLLNGSDGIIGRKQKKILLSTNLPTIDKIDPALLRVGRCFDILEFRPLTVPQASRVLQDLGFEPKDLSAKMTWTHAEILNDSNLSRQRVNRFATKVGY